MLRKFFRLIYILLHPVFLLVCFVLVPIGILSTSTQLYELKDLENGSIETVKATVIDWKAGNISRQNDISTRHPYTVRYQFIPKHLPQVTDNLVISSSARPVPKTLWDETRNSKQIDIYYLIDNPENHQVVGWQSPSYGDLIIVIVLLIILWVYAGICYIKKERILTIDGFKKGIGWTAFIDLFNLDKLTNLKAYRQGEIIAEQLFVTDRYCKSIADLMSYDQNLQIQAIQNLQQLAKMGQSLDHHILKILAAFIKRQCYSIYEGYIQTEQPKSKLDKFLLATDKALKDLFYLRSRNLNYTHDTVASPILASEIESYVGAGKAIHLNPAVQEALNAIGRVSNENQAKINLSELVFRYYVFSGSYIGINFKKSIFDNTVCKGVVFSHCNLEKSSFKHANCEHVKFVKSKCRYASFQASNCSQADFTGADYFQANFSETNLDGAIFD